jgi:hypothetical protein
MTLTTDQENQLKRLKQYFPYRIIFGVIYPTGEFETYAEHDKRKMNKFVKLGYTVFKID